QVVELHAIGIRFRNINSAVAGGGVLLHNVDDRERVPIREPPVKRWHSHISGSLRPGSETRERGKIIMIKNKKRGRSMLPFNVRAAAVAALFYETKMPLFRSALVEPVARVRYCMFRFEH
ncbi:hypothetical protein V8G54_032859, partial [Vigna mungo]